MARFRSYTDYEPDNNGDIDNYWSSNTNHDYDNKIANKGIFRAFSDLMKYGSLKKEVLR